LGVLKAELTEVGVQPTTNGASYRLRDRYAGAKLLRSEERGLFVVN
jgi:hypothetical protein